MLLERAPAMKDRTTTLLYECAGKNYYLSLDNVPDGDAEGAVKGQLNCGDNMNLNLQRLEHALVAIFHK